VSAAVAQRANTESAGVLPATLALSFIALFAIAMRIAWLMWHGPSEITEDGAEYARIALNLLSGHGYVGLRGTTMFVFPPLYPLAIAAIFPLAHNAVQAGLAVSLLSGAALIFPIYGIAATCYGRRAGFTAALLTAVLPFLVQLSSVVLADSLFLTLATAGTFFLLRTANDKRAVDAVACGASFALAYLTRPEGLLLELLALAVIVAAFVPRTTERRRIIPLVLAAALPFAVLASPYVVFLSSHAGHLRVEGKSILNLDIGLRMDRGMSYVVAADAIDDSLAQIGPEIRQDYYFEPAGRTQPPLATILAFGTHNLVRHVREIAHVAASRLCGTVLFALLAIVGFVAGPWSKRRTWNQAILVANGVVFAIALASVYHFWDRYFIGFVPLLIVWAANGIEALTRAATARSTARWLRVAPAALAGAFLVVLVFSMKISFADDATNNAEEQAGLWLAQHGGAGSRILSISDQAPFYADGTWFMLPYAPSDDAARRYVQKIHPDFVVLDREFAAERPYATTWLASGIPIAGAQIVYARSDRGAPSIQIVRVSASR
jgi:4-amino-4-deoxy-L-arabinose transferase-like glycosyltransferase